MFPPWRIPVWQVLAHVGQPFANAFASPARIAQDGSKTWAFGALSLFYDDCYPSPYPWPDPLRVRPFFGLSGQRGIDDLAISRVFGFHLLQNAVESWTIKIITRGSVTCVNRPLSSWRFVRPHFQLVLTTILNVARSVRLAALLLPMRSAATPLPARLSAVPVAWSATIWASASNSAVSLPRSARTGNQPALKTTLADGRGGFLFLAAPFGQTLKGRKCSTRS